MFSDREELVLQYAKTKRADIREKIIVSYKPLIEYISKKMAYNKDDFDDLIQIATIALLRSLDRYNPARDVDFSSFASPNIIGEIKHYYRDKGNLIKIPRRIQETYNKVKNFINVFHQENGKTPTIREIASTIEISEEHIIEVLETIQLTSIISLDSPIYNDTYIENNSKLSLINSLGISHKENKTLLEENLKEALSQLNERQKNIIFLKFFEGYSQREIAEKIHLSQMHISRLLADAIEALKKKMEIKQIKGGS
ncbi:MAG: sigma-70 family RNA polymerase sigma factor [Candidatus Margulisiibacteriota bacterium]